MIIFQALAAVGAGFAAAGTVVDLRAHASERIGAFAIITTPARVLNVASLLTLQVAFTVLFSVDHRSYHNASTLAISLPITLLVIALFLTVPRLLHNRGLQPSVAEVDIDEPDVDGATPPVDRRVSW
ncbi:MAG: hypothetical protein JWO63_1132 [Frankiales bacterium]|nr:hypothetical protein [Frankiales bacterium]